MAWFDTVSKVYKALEAGHQLEDSNVWANKAALVGNLTVVATALSSVATMFGYDLQLGGTDIAAIALGLGTLGTAITNVLHVASNKDAGKVRNKPKH